MPENTDRVGLLASDVLIRQLYAVGLHVRSCADQSDDPQVASRLHDTARELDRVVHDLQCAALRSAEDLEDYSYSRLPA